MAERFEDVVNAEIDKTVAQLPEVSAPLRKWLSDNKNPHTIAIVSTTGVEILEGQINFPNLNEFIKD